SARVCRSASWRWMPAVRRARLLRASRWSRADAESLESEEDTDLRSAAVSGGADLDAARGGGMEAHRAPAAGTGHAARPDGHAVVGGGGPAGGGRRQPGQARLGPAA